MNTESGTSDGEVPTYGSLATKDHLFYMTSLDIGQLLAIAQSAPADVRNTIQASPTKEQLLAEVFRLCDLEKAAHQETSPLSAAASLRTLMEMSTADILKSSQEKPSDLLELMKKALPADSSLTPRSIPTANPSEAAAIAIGWQLDAFRQNYPPNNGQVTPAPDIPPPPANQSALGQQAPTSAGPLAALFATNHNPAPNPDIEDGNSDEDDDEPPRKKQKGLVVSQNYTIGLEEAENATLKHYPGKEASSTSLFVDRLLGPSILNMLTAGWADIPTFLSSKFQHWRRSASGQPLAAEMEASTLGRIIHLTILTFENPKQAMEQVPALEVAFRRLLAILHVGESVSRGDYADKREAWEETIPLLENVPQGTVRSVHLLEEILRSLNQKKKRCTAIKAIQDAKHKSRSGRSSKPRDQTQPHSANHRQARN
eukprot:TRINITY_DN305_c0_g1_i7.p2 TRINITY_DN305_c0_g1~~TRINITY_DN305_c0_g1_i7.p2  ORF type:complete len:428 (+),score=52.17 TRINITY_DN305_c0_g1_i7:2562-3845(+)